jgi:hypothetical protein
MAGTVDDLEISATVKEAVRTNSLKGFAHSVQALCAYDIRERMAAATVPGLLLHHGQMAGTVDDLEISATT